MEAPSWADQWGEGGIGVFKQENKTEVKKEDKNVSNTKKMDKAKAAAMVGAQKVKNGTASGIKWIKTKCQKKSPSK
ncbi:hypothetical protein FRX31_015072 [Thalictrum thalictroides]|uniref:Ankyrin repeat family protein n=1 Tax=Thalictrum thalictroides TaxID=46969 RepID=A0A7J6WD82_THATH|nr:hypothetical protein FRX31_015072 [Thalictrum thalictroides]